MDFSFNEDQRLLRETLAEFGRRELAPYYAERDGDENLPREFVRKLGAMGLLAPMADTAHGGQNLDYISLGIAHEEIARELGISQTAAKVRLHRARRRLREQLFAPAGAAGGLSRKRRHPRTLPFAGEATGAVVGAEVGYGAEGAIVAELETEEAARHAAAV